MSIIPAFTGRSDFLGPPYPKQYLFSFTNKSRGHLKFSYWKNIWKTAIFLVSKASGDVLYHFPHRKHSLCCGKTMGNITLKTQHAKALKWKAVPCLGHHLLSWALRNADPSGFIFQASPPPAFSVFNLSLDVSSLLSVSLPLRSPQKAKGSCSFRHAALL